MTEPKADATIRDAIFEHEMFNTMNINSSYVLESIRHVEATWTYSATDLAEELCRMEAEGLLLRKTGFGGDAHEYWEATHTGKIAREGRWQELGRRHPALSDRTASAEDLVIAVVASRGDEQDVPGSSGLDLAAVSVYLAHLGEPVCEATVNELIVRGLIRREDEDILNWPFRLTLTADGRRHYAHDIVGRLGLQPPATILAPTEPDQAPFDDLGLAPTLTDNLRYRWEEAGRCVEARAWLAATALYGSILEVVLPDWLGRDMERTKTARAAPLDKQKQMLPVESWNLATLIKVAVELECLDESLGRHAQALRESRNLIHPDRQIRERSTPDGHTAAISKQVVQAVLSALARTTQPQTSRQ
ncbi:hypothetical protein [Burkholderia ubonensis]|uniref:hypothetical protein n=1 Tax=Burkholderia ubonensis TaxID=101571 RepID=UPI0012F8F4DA|nr:hypothetical protein [Burkholderia ubonensis]